MKAVLPNASVRLKLTLVYGGLFLLAGAGLLAVNYALVSSRFELPFGVRIENRRALLHSPGNRNSPTRCVIGNDPHLARVLGFPRPRRSHDDHDPEDEPR